MIEDKNRQPDFSGKCLSITLIDNDSSHDLYDPTFEYQCGRLFLTGRSPAAATESSWTEGCQIVVAWDRVSDYFVFDNLDHYIQGTEKSKAFNRDSEE